MTHTFLHSLKRRRISAVLLTAVYMVIALAPLAPLALSSKAVAHAVTGECAGDCSICGCSMESRASKTCCCALKQRQQMEIAESADKTCCPEKPVQPPAPNKPSCCRTPRQVHDDQNHEMTAIVEQTKAVTVLKCGGPCGKSKLFALGGIGSNELIPIIFSKMIVRPYAERISSDLTRRLVSRSEEPPDPPPRCSVSA